MCSASTTSIRKSELNSNMLGPLCYPYLRRRENGKYVDIIKFKVTLEFFCCLNNTSTSLRNEKKKLNKNV